MVSNTLRIAHNEQALFVGCELLTCVSMCVCVCVLCVVDGRVAEREEFYAVRQAVTS